MAHTEALRHEGKGSEACLTHEVNGSSLLPHLCAFVPP